MREARMGLEAIYEEFFSKIYNYIYYRLLNREETEDLVSEIFLKVARGLPGYDPDRAKVSTWLYRIAHNALTDYYRARKPSALDIDDVSLSTSFEAEYDRILEPKRKALFRALSALPERDRSLVYDKYFLNLSNLELAKRNGMNASTVGTVLLRAREKLRAELEREDPEI